MTASAADKALARAFARACLAVAGAPVITPVIALVIALVIAPGAAVAQGAPAGLGPPRSLLTPPSAPPLPRTPDPVLGPPAVVQPSRPEVPPSFPAAREAAASGTEAKSGVMVDRLGGVDPDSVGILDDAGGGFGIAMWRGTGRPLVEQLLPALPAATQSRAARALLQRLLATTATAPGGERGASLLALRVDRLLAMGDVRRAAELAALRPPDSADPMIDRAAVEALFAGADNAGACRRASALPAGLPQAYGQRARAFCQILAGERQEAQLTVDVLRESAADKVGPAWFAIADALLGNRAAAVKSLPDPSALDLAMMRVAKLAVPADAANSDRPAVLAMIALSPVASLELRLAAAERAEAVGALATDTLSEIYLGLPISADALADPVAVAAGAWGPRGRALLLRAATAETAPAPRARLIGQALALARKQGGEAGLRRVFLPLVVALQPHPSLADFAPQAARVLFAAGRTDLAARWVALAASTGAPADAPLWPYFALSGATAGSPLEPGRLEKWLASGDASSGGMLVPVLAALGEPVSDAAWLTLLRAPRQVAAIPPAALLVALDRAAVDARLGETVLLTLVTLGEGGPAGAHPAVLAAVIRALKAVGLEADARAMSVEAALAAGV